MTDHEYQLHAAAIIESSDDAIISKRLDSVVTSWNAAAERLFEYRADEIIGRSIEILIPGDSRHEEAMILENIRNGRKIDHYEATRLTKSGKPLSVSLTISPIRDPSGLIIGASKIVRDVTEWRRIQEALRAAKEAAEESNRSKDRFIAMLSHELRTPLTPALATLSYLEDSPGLPAELYGHIAVVRRNIEHETRLIDDLLDMTRIIRGKLELQFSRVDVHDLIRRVAEMFKDEVDVNGLNISTDLRAHGYCVRGDETRLRQVLWNLVGNAVKFTPPGGRIGLSTENAHPGFLTFKITDSGIGIERAVLPNLFHAFEQSGRVPGRARNGLGLGLTVCKMLINLHGGTLSAESEGLGRGSTFTAEIGLHSDASVAEPATVATPAPPDRVLRILLVEDNPDILHVLSRLLRASGFSVRGVATANEAYEVAATSSFDLLLSDIGLPDGSGLDVMRLMRAKYGLKGIAFSGYGTEADVRSSKEAGFAEHLTKPVKFEALINTIRRTAS